MPKQIISDTFGELLETGKKTGQQLSKLPGEMVKEAAEQTGVRPQSGDERAAGEAKIAEMKKKDEEKKGKDIAFVKRQLVEFQNPPPSKPSVQEEQITEKREEMVVLEKEKKKELPPLVAAVKRRAGRVEIKTGPAG